MTRSLPWRDMLTDIHAKGMGWKGIGNALHASKDSVRHFACGSKPSLFVSFERGTQILKLYATLCPDQFRRIRPTVLRELESITSAEKS